MTFDPSRLGEWSDTGRFDVSPQQVAAYASATNEPPRRYPAGAAAPPVFALLPAIDVYPQQVERLFGQTLASMGSVHGEHDLLIDQPVLAGTTVSTRVAVTGVHVKASGTAVVVQIESRGEHGTLLNTQYAVQFLRGFDAGASAGAQPPAWLARNAARDERPAASTTLKVDPDQARRYAEASGDFGDYTLDDGAARRAASPANPARRLHHGPGRPGRDHRLRGGDPARLRRLAVRFSAPCFPGDQLTTTIWPLRDDVPRASVVFEVTDQEGRKADHERHPRRRARDRGLHRRHRWSARFDPAALQAWTATRTFLVDPDACPVCAPRQNEADPERWASGMAPPCSAWSPPSRTCTSPAGQRARRAARRPAACTASTTCTTTGR